MKYRMGTIGVSILAMACGSIAHAQDKGPSAQKAQTQGSDDGIAEIIVTAQRRAESAQDVPIAVAAFSGDQMTKAGIATTADLASVIPGVTIFPSGTRSSLYLRGVGNNVQNTSPNVLTFVDGVYQPFDQTGVDFSNVQSIELAKGPQGTLFGRNATGGVLQITTRNPFDWQGLDVQVGYGNYDTFSGKVYGSAKLSEMLAADIAGFYENQSDGWGVNRADDSPAYTAKRYGVRSKWVAKLSDSFTGTLVGDYAYRKGQLGVGISPSVTTNLLYNSVLGTSFTLPSNYDIRADTVPMLSSEESGGALTLDKELGDVKLLSISSYRHLKEHMLIDFDGTDTRVPPVGSPSFPGFFLDIDSKRQAFTQEFQVSGHAPGLDWVVGLYYYWAKNDAIFDLGGFIPSLPTVFNTGSPTIPLNVYFTDQTNAYAAYGQATFGITPSTNLTLGARYTIEKREMTGHTTGSLTFSPGAGTQRKTFKKPNFRVALDQKLAPDVMAYASWSRAFNAGFFNGLSIAGFNDVVNPPVEPEVIDAYEVGIKSDLLNRHLRVNLAGFIYDYSNLQQQIFAFGSIRTVNAASARIKGIDLDIVARPVRDFTLSVSANYLDSHFKSYPAAPDYVLLPSGELAVQGSRDAAGKRLVNAPEFGLQVSATYTLRTDIGTFDTTGNINYQSKFYADAQNRFALPHRTLVSLTEQWTSNDGNTTVTAWVKNLTNKVYDVSYALQTPVGLVGNPGAPRTYGITIGRKF